jgi:hypothetical protein
MTIALGIRTAEGVVCVTDSMRVDWAPAWPKVELDGSKFTRVSNRIYTVVSGFFQAGIDPDQDLEVDEVDVAAALMWPALLGIRRLSDPRVSEGREHPTHLLLAGGPAGADPRLMLMCSDRDPVIVEGDVVAGGAMSEWAAAHHVDQLRAPASITAGRELAQQLCRGYLEDTYRGWGIEELLDTAALLEEVKRPGGALPPSAFPLHLVAITADEITEWEVAR